MARAGAEAFHVANRPFPSGNASSKNDAGDSILRATIDGPQWLTGGAFGAEASVISMVVVLAVTAVFVKKILSTRQSR